MMNKRTAAQGFGIVLATPLAIAFAAVAYKAWPQLHVSTDPDDFCPPLGCAFQSGILAFHTRNPYHRRGAPSKEQAILWLASFPRKFKTAH